MASISPSRSTCYDHYEHRSQAAANATLKVGENMTETDVNGRYPAGPEGRRAAQVGLPVLHERLPPLRRVGGRQRGPGAGLLDTDDIAKNTIVIYTSDQGFFLGDHGYFDKRFMYEESLRMPFLLRYPGVVKPGSVNRDMILNLDFAETFLDFAGAKPPAEMQGRSFRPILEGHTPRDWRQSMYYRYWMHLADHGVPAHYGVRTKQWKLIYYYGKALGTSGAIDRDTDARVGTVRHGERPARDEQSLRRSETYRRSGPPQKGNHAHARSVRRQRFRISGRNHKGPLYPAGPKTRNRRILFLTTIRIARIRTRVT